MLLLLMTPELVLSIKQLRDQAVTTKILGRYPEHFASLSAMRVKKLISGKAIKLPPDADGVRIMLELSTGKLSRYSHNIVCNLLDDVETPEISSKESRMAQARLDIDFQQMKEKAN
ncbi:MAG: hypothetical protein HKP55_04055 [Gammaproteobacteria bacterium]|nr:hypothetical protein [Gammaproteobacteria bacterium]